MAVPIRRIMFVVKSGPIAKYGDGSIREFALESRSMRCPPPTISQASTIDEVCFARDAWNGRNVAAGECLMTRSVHGPSAIVMTSCAQGA